MDPRTQERVEQWDSRPFSGGRDGLADLADAGFSGVVTTGDVWLFVLNGRAVGVDGGDLEDFETASGTAYVAPDPAPPLLAAMKTLGGETRAKYYTNKTPLTDVDETLQDGSFTGYVELSEQVLSGDYYLVYYGGRRMAAAYIGNAGRLLTDEEAFERAADEVGIYEVVDVGIDVIDLAEVVDDEPEEDEPTPEPAVDEQQVTTVEDATVGDASAEDATTEADATATPIEPAEPAVADADQERTDPAAVEETSSEPAADEPAADEPTADELTTSEPTSPESAGGVSARPETGTDEAADAAGVAGDDRDQEPSEETPDETDDEETAIPTEEDAIEQAEEPTPVESSDEPNTEPGDRPEEPTAAEDASSDGETTASFSERVVDTADEKEEVDERFKQEERWRETRSIPSIDPGKTSESTTRRRRTTEHNDSGATTSSASSTSQTSVRRAGQPTASERTETNASETDTSSTDQKDARSREEHVEKLRKQRDALQAKLEEYQDERERLEEQNEALTEERDELRAKNRNLSATVERLEERVEELEAKLERTRSLDATGAVTESTAESQFPADRALEGTNLFVRYESKGKATLEKVHAGEADPEQVSENLRLEHHTDFDASEVTIDGQPYEEFLPTTMQYRFVDWLVDTLPYEIRDTGRTGGLADLYDAVPAIDRIELEATVSLADDDTEDVPEEVGFDVVVFDKMGRPLVVANLNDSRDPATREMLERLEKAASAVKANYPELAAAVAVTSSFFQPGALEVTEAATSSGLLSRSSKLNYVNVSRKQGYHLCLVEARSGGFHMTVPEL